MEKNVINKRVALALDEARIKNGEGLLVSCADPNFDELMDNVSTPDGDRETVYSIISLYGEGDDECEDTISKELQKLYSDYF